MRWAITREKSDFIPYPLAREIDNDEDDDHGHAGAREVPTGLVELYRLGHTTKGQARCAEGTEASQLA